MGIYNYEVNPQGIANIKSERMDYNLSRIIEIIDDKLKKKNCVKILEPGCGGGRNLDFLKRRYGNHVQVYGNDISNISINYAKANIPGCFVVAKTINDCFAGEFDLIIMLDILEHLPTINEVQETIKLAQKKISKDGTLFISCPIELNKYSICWFFKKVNFWSDVTLKYYGHTIQFTENDILNLVKNYFKIKNINYNVHFLTQISVMFFFYLPMQILNFLGGNKSISLFKESNIKLRSNNILRQNFIKLASIIFLILRSPFYFIGFCESKLRRKSKFGAMVINIEC